MESNFDEMSDLMNSGVIKRFVLMGLIPLALIWIIPFQRSRRWKELRYKLQLTTIAIMVMVLCVLTLGDHYASFFREHKPVRY